jgi:simple sugar transport system substrate-binding protein
MRKRFAISILGAVALSLSVTVPAVVAGAGTTTIPKTVRIAFLGGAPTDPFWTTVHNGVNAARADVKSEGGVVQWFGFQNYNNFCPDAGQLIKTIRAWGPTVAVVPNWCPTTETAGIKAMVKAGVDVIEVNNFATWQADGALTYVGASNAQVGAAAGTTFVNSGYKNLVCVNTLPGTVTSEALCDAMKAKALAAGGTYDELNLPSSAFGSPTAVESAIKGFLLANTSYNGVMTIDTGDADSAAAALASAGLTKTVALGSWDLSTNVLNRIQAGTELFTIDQEPYLQGFYGIIEAFQYAKWDIIPSGPLPTGPNVVDAGNVAKAIAGTALGVR